MSVETPFPVSVRKGVPREGSACRWNPGGQSPPSRQAVLRPSVPSVSPLYRPASRQACRPVRGTHLVLGWAVYPCSPPPASKPMSSSSAHGQTTSPVSQEGPRVDQEVPEVKGGEDAHEQKDQAHDVEQEGQAEEESTASEATRSPQLPLEHRWEGRGGRGPALLPGLACMGRGWCCQPLPSLPAGHEQARKREREPPFLEPHGSTGGCRFMSAAASGARYFLTVS